MQRMAIIVAAGLACSVAVAGPTGPAGPGKKIGISHKKASVKPTAPGANPELLGWVENYDSYTTGSGLNGQGNWVAWWTTGVDAIMVDVPTAHSLNNSMEYNFNFNDNVQQLGYQNKVFAYSCWVYIDSQSFGDGYVICLNDYVHQAAPGGSAQWSSQAMFSMVASPPTVRNDAAGFANAPTLPLILDQWVEYILVVDLANDVLRDYYDGQLLSSVMPGGETLTWTGTPDPVTGGQTNQLISPAAPEFLVFAALDLFSNGIDLMYIDDPKLVCYADMDQSTGIGVLDFIDFATFAGLFAQNHPLACDADVSTGYNTCDFIDFATFAGMFAAGCN